MRQRDQVFADRIPQSCRKRNHERTPKHNIVKEKVQKNPQRQTRGSIFNKENGPSAYKKEAFYGAPASIRGGGGSEGEVSQIKELKRICKGQQGLLINKVGYFYWN